jgi:hypothetical protein
MTFAFERRAYGPEDFTPEFRRALKERIYIQSGDIVVWHELPTISIHTAELNIQNFEELTKNMGRYRALIDLTLTGTRGAEGRDRYSKAFRGDIKSGRCYDSAIVTGSNILINAAVQFVAKAMGLRRFSVHKTVEDALAALASRSLRASSPRLDGS